MAPREHALVPGLPGVRLAAVREERLSVDECLDSVRCPSFGGMVVFVGSVRDHDAGAAVDALEYEAHPDAGFYLLAVAEEVAGRFPGCALAVTHRVGFLAIGELAVVAAAAAPHRQEAFEAARSLIDTLKQRVPIWKLEHRAGGSQVWVGCEDDQQEGDDHRQGSDHRQWNDYQEGDHRQWSDHRAVGDGGRHGVG